MENIDILHYPCDKLPPQQLRGKAMATIDILSLIGKGEINKAQRDHLTKELRARRRKLLDAIKKVDQGLKALARKSKSKRRKKR
jgi:hypothetical protein